MSSLWARLTGSFNSSHEKFLPSHIHGAKLSELEKIASELIKRVKDDSNARLNIRKEFYKRYGHESWWHRFGIGDSEIAFLQWEKRSILNPPQKQPPGSPWWRQVNLQFIYWSELAALIYEDGLDTTDLNIPPQVLFWIDFIKSPSNKNWYRAHNSSITAAYHQYANLATQEIFAEQVFMNMVLYRLLFAQAMVEADKFAFGNLGKVLANPALPAVDVIVHDRFFYPETYPLTQEEQKIILGKEHNIGELIMKVFDDSLVLPHLEELYTQAASINETPGLMHYIENGKPAYPQLL